jgi:hypothetical protein
MLTVEKVSEKELESSNEQLKSPDQKKKKPVWPWLVGGVLLVGGIAWFLSRNKAKGTNAGISS